MKTLFFCLALVSVTTSAAFAQSTVDGTGKLTVNVVPASSETNTIILCSPGGNVSINGLAPFNGAFSCSSITEIEINGTSLPDTIDLTAVLTSSFSNLGKVTINAGEGDDSIVGSDARDVIDAGSGDDTVLGGLGRDRLLGGSGDDELRGGDANDVLIGNSGNDKLFGEGGKDTLRGGSGNDRLVGGPKIDLLFGGSGVNRLVQ
jgi:Ca2+-binding RTX toxin-like protein